MTIRLSTIDFYPLKHWIFVMLTGPPLWLLYAIFIDNDRPTVCYRIFWEVAGLQIFFSFPALILYSIFFLMVKKILKKQLAIKLSANLFITILMCITFRYIGRSVIGNFFIPYFLAIIVGSSFLKLKSLKQ